MDGRGRRPDAPAENRNPQEVPQGKENAVSGDSGYTGYAGGPRAGAGDGSSLRDWQRNTWYGPAPRSADPFDEPPDAPELKAFRSENVNNRQGMFWTPQSTGYSYGASDLSQAEAAARTSRTPEARRALRRRVIALSLAVLLAVGLVLRFAVFSVRSVLVVGNSEIPSAEIIRRSGIREGDFILGLDEKEIERRVTEDYRLQYRYLARNLPSQVTISVREREPCCWLTWCGIVYVLDKNRMVLRETEDPEEKPGELVEVRGLEVRSGAQVGQVIMLGSEAQQEIFKTLFVELKVLGCADLIAEADMSNPSSLLLATRDGFTVSLGNIDRLHAKLRSMQLVRQELLNMGQSGGAISVIDPATPIYTP